MNAQVLVCRIASLNTKADCWLFVRHRPERHAQVCCIAVLLSAVYALPAMAATQDSPPESHVAYRLTEAKTKHFDDPQKAEQHLQTLKKLGCEISQANHEGHNDFAYRCAKWRVLPVAKEELAHQWEAWLKEAGFETIHGHAAKAGHEHAHEHEHEHADEHGEDHEHAHEGESHEEVTYRLATSVTFHPQQEIEAQELVAILQGLGCEVREAQHAGHRDISISCPEWKHAEFPSHEAAEAWQQWLTKNGFETQHTH